MKRIFCTVLCLLMLAPALVSCHGARSLDAFVMPEEFDSTKTHEITFWAKSDSNVTQTNIYKKAIADFEALYPNVNVSLKLYNDYGRIYNDVITNISTQTTPNVCITYPDHIATYMSGANVVAPLDELSSDAKYGFGGSSLLYDAPTREEMIPKFLDECYIGDTLYAIPFMRSTEACYVNVDLVNKLGYTLPEKLTWDFVFEVSHAAMEMDADGNYKINGQKTMIPFIYKSTDNMMIQMLKQKGAGYSTDEGEILIFNDTTTELLKMLEQPAKDKEFSTFKISSYPGNFLNAGQCIFAIDSTAGATWMGSDAPLSDIDEENIVHFKTEVMAIPQFDTENPYMISQGPSVCVFNKADPQEVLASWLFAQFLLTNDVQISYSQTEGYLPVTSKAQSCAEYIDYLANEGKDNELYYDVKIKAVKLLLDNIENTFVTPVFNGSASLRNAAGQLIENVTKSMRRNETVDEAYYEKLKEDITSLYRLDRLEKKEEGKAELGELPTGAKVIISALCIVWVLIFVAFVFSLIKKRVKNSSKT